MLNIVAIYYFVVCYVIGLLILFGVACVCLLFGYLRYGFVSGLFCFGFTVVFRCLLVLLVCSVVVLVWI